MKMTGTEQIKAPREVVWRALNDLEVLKQCIPGCQTLEQTGENAMAATVRLKIGIVSATFNGDVQLTNIRPSEGYRIAGEGKGGVAGFAKGGADVSLSDAADGTLLTYDCEAQVGGKLAQMGARLIDSTAKKLAAQFFARFNEVVGQTAS